MKLYLYILLFLAIESILHLQGQTVTPDQWLNGQLKPNFAANHGYPPLTKFSWPFTFNLRKELADNWGYGLEIGIETLSELTNVNSVDYLVLQLAKTDTNKYKLTPTVGRLFTYQLPNEIKITNFSDAMFVTNDLGYFIDYQTNTWLGHDGQTYSSGHQPVFSPEGPDADHQLYANVVSNELYVLLANNVNVGLILHGGEDGMSVRAGIDNIWAFDPRCLAIGGTNLNGQLNDGTFVYEYLSQQKGRQQKIVYDSIKAAMGNRKYDYVYYNTGYEMYRFNQEGMDWLRYYAYWGFDSQYMNACTSLRSDENYYKASYSYGIATNNTPYNIYDMLLLHLNWMAYNRALGSNDLHYSWVSGGWSSTEDENLISDTNRYTGFLKSMYTSGTIGACSGYFAWPASPYGDYAASFPSNAPPHWLKQLVNLAHVHALFTHLESLVTNSLLLPGTYTSRKCLDQNAFEFTNPTNGQNEAVLVRKHNSGDVWLVSAWARVGDGTPVTITTIPGISSLTVTTAPNANIYWVNKSDTNITTILLDEYGQFPSLSDYIKPQTRIGSWIK